MRYLPHERTSAQFAFNYIALSGRMYSGDSRALGRGKGKPSRPMPRQFQRHELPGGDFLEQEGVVFRVRSQSGADCHEGKNGEQRDIAGAIRQCAPFVFGGSADDLDDECDAYPKGNVKVRFPRQPGACERNFLGAGKAEFTQNQAQQGEDYQVA